MPTISSFRSNPSFTPVTMFATSARARPCSARTFRSSPLREMTSWLFSIFALSPAGTGCDSLPFGPSARITAPSRFTFTPCGMATGWRPIRDMRGLLPHVGEDFPADLLLARVAIGHPALRRRDQRHAHPGQDGRDLVAADVHAPPGRRDPDQPGDHLLVPHPVLEIHAQHPLLLVLEHPEVLDEALVLQQLGDAHLEPRAGDVHLLVLGPARVADTREHVGDRIASHGPYQLAFTMPGTSPLSASSRKQSRHISNFRRYPRGRPHSLHRE